MRRFWRRNAPRLGRAFPSPRIPSLSGSARGTRGWHSPRRTSSSGASMRVACLAASSARVAWWKAADTRRLVQWNTSSATRRQMTPLRRGQKRRPRETSRVCARCSRRLEAWKGATGPSGSRRVDRMTRMMIFSSMTTTSTQTSSQPCWDTPPWEVTDRLRRSEQTTDRQSSVPVTGLGRRRRRLDVVRLRVVMKRQIRRSLDFCPTSTAWMAHTVEAARASSVRSSTGKSRKRRSQKRAAAGRTAAMTSPKRSSIPSSPRCWRGRPTRLHS